MVDVDEGGAGWVGVDVDEAGAGADFPSPEIQLPFLSEVAVKPTPPPFIAECFKRSSDSPKNKNQKNQSQGQ